MGLNRSPKRGVLVALQGAQTLTGLTWTPTAQRHTVGDYLNAAAEAGFWRVNVSEFHGDIHLVHVLPWGGVVLEPPAVVRGTSMAGVLTPQNRIIWMEQWNTLALLRCMTRKNSSRMQNATMPGIWLVCQFVTLPWYWFDTASC